ncbi:hypothetical protein J6590_059177 [Homalodisca vitripennis]|nr:hypothetical protein J6590_059177 [Homalodisca vitripennis]
MTSQLKYRTGDVNAGRRVLPTTDYRLPVAERETGQLECQGPSVKVPDLLCSALDYALSALSRHFRHSPSYSCLSPPSRGNETYPFVFYT